MFVFRLELLLGETSLANLALFRRMMRWCAIRDYKRSLLFIVIRRRYQAKGTSLFNRGPSNIVGYFCCMGMK